MARGRKTSLTISLTVEEPQTLMAWQRSTTIRAGRAKRGRVILLIADRVPLSHIATISGVISPLTPTSQRAGTRRGVSDEQSYWYSLCAPAQRQAKAQV